MLLYRAVWVVFAQGARLLWRVRVYGRELLPKSGGYVIAASHRSMLDIQLLAIATPRRLRFMGKQQSFAIPVLGRIFRRLGGFPVARDGTDRRAIRDATKMLLAGEVIAIFPEGTRQRGPKIEALQPGAAYLALRAGVPLVPVGLAGSEEVLRSHRRRFPAFGRVVLVVGEPLVVPTRDTGTVPRADVDALTDRLHESLQRLFAEAYRLRDGVDG